MDAEFTGKVIEVLLRVALGIGAIFAIMYCVRKSEEKKLKPEQTLDARVASKRVSPDNIRFVIFDMEDGATVEMRVSEEIYNLIAQGDVGRVTFREREFVRFERIA